MLRFYGSMSDHAQVGPDYPMEAVGGGLAAKIIRPTQIVGILTLTHVDSTLEKSPHTYWIHIKWNEVPCPESQGQASRRP